MRKHFIMALAALGFAACSESVDDPNASINKGDLEESYIAINLMAADANTRAATDSYGYEEGTEAERKIHSAYFFFFDDQGNPFNVTGAPATAPGDEKNHLQLSISENTTSGMPNVSDIKEAVLILNTYKGVYPSKIVAVINWTPKDKAYSLEDLHTILGNIRGEENSFVMSNSVYMDGANIVDAVPLTTDNIKKTEDDAKAAPVNIYVERTAAKVVLSASGKVLNTKNIFKVTSDESPLKPIGGSNIQVYMQLLGWELYNDYNTSNLLKNIENWDVTTLGLTWNDIPYFRCYWATSQPQPTDEDYKKENVFSWEYNKDTGAETYKGFPTAHGFAVAETTSESNNPVYAPGTYTYCGENTNQVSGTSDPRTKVILKGQLMQTTQETTEYPSGYKPLEIASWYGNDYAGLQNLKTAVANSLKYTLVYQDGGSFTGIKPEDLECVAGDDKGKEAYQVVFQLSNAGKNKEWYTRSSENSEIKLGSVDTEGEDNITATNNYLVENVEPALLYTNGMTYYFVDIEHLGTKGAQFGVVRNHVYQIDINSIKGFGSPVYTNFDYIVEQPEYPEDYDDTYVAAKINVLSWKIVKQSVNIQP